MKYRLLTSEELKELEPEFINFLAANHVTASDWLQLKTENIQKAERLIEIFSDIVLEKVLLKIDYLEIREEKNLLIFNFKEEKIILIGIAVKENSTLDLSNTASIASIALNPERTEEERLTIFKTEKDYQKARPEEVFKLVQQGGFITDEKLFTILNSVKS